MNIKQIHFNIEQLLQEQAIFSNRDMQHDEIDSAFNFVVNEAVSALLSDTKLATDGGYAELNQYYTDIASVLKRQYVSGGNKVDNRFYVPLPSDYLALISDASYVYKSCNGKLVNVTDIKANTYYRVVNDVKYKNKWYKKDEIFKTDSNISIYTKDEKVFELSVELKPNRLKRSEDLIWLLEDSLHGTSYRSPISELVNKDLIIYLKDFEVVNVAITYYKTPVNINYSTGQTSEFPDNVIYYLIRKTYEHIEQSIKK